MIKRGDIFYANLSPVVGSEQGGSRPVLILQNNIGNKYSPTIIVAAITAQITKGKLPTHIELKADKCKLERDSVVLLEQLRTIDKKRLRNKITTLDNNIMKSVDEAVKVSMGLVQF
nr:type II toxin-antitoxin system PemK/MazF family toxin [Pectinatus cerevisiiphilus]